MTRGIENTVVDYIVQWAFMLYQGILVSMTALLCIENTAKVGCILQYTYSPEEKFDSYVNYKIF